jgi:NTE family protein
MMAGIALGADAEQIDWGTHNIFVKSRVFRRPTVSRYSLLDHKAFDRALRTEYGDVLIENLWHPFFALSTNLSTNQPYRHSRGKLWQAVRASGSIPGLLPPFFTDDGDMLVDGAIMNNLPLEQMKELKTGPNVVVRLTPSEPKKYAVDYDYIPGTAESIVSMLNPFVRRRLSPIPSMIQVIARSMLAHQPSDPALGEEDVLICPPLPDGHSFMDWSRHTQLFLDAYRHTTIWIEERQREEHKGVRAIFGVEQQ